MTTSPPTVVLTPLKEHPCPPVQATGPGRWNALIALRSGSSGQSTMRFTSSCSLWMSGKLTHIESFHAPFYKPDMVFGQSSAEDSGIIEFR